MKNCIVLPTPIIDYREEKTLDDLTHRYKELMKPSAVAKVGDKAVKAIPEPIKKYAKDIGLKIEKIELYTNCMKVVVEGFSILERNAAKYAISIDTIIKNINNSTKSVEINSLEEVCLARSYDISKCVGKYRTKDLALACVEGGVTGAFGFKGLPFNIVLSMFLYFKAVQSIALYYGYDVINESSELVIASDVFMLALSPDSNGANEVTDLIAKFMMMAQVTTLKQMSKKTWQEMAQHGGITLLVCQMRALANQAANTALQKAGKAGLENSLFRTVFEQIGKNLTKKSINRGLPVVGGFIGAGFDTAQMNKVLEYADVFYNKRFLTEKEVRINTLLHKRNNK